MVSIPMQGIRGPPVYVLALALANCMSTTHPVSTLPSSMKIDTIILAIRWLAFRRCLRLYGSNDGVDPGLRQGNDGGRNLGVTIALLRATGRGSTSKASQLPCHPPFGR